VGATVLSCKAKQKAKSSKDISKEQATSENINAKFPHYFIEGCKERMKGNIVSAEQLFNECLKIDQNSAAVKYELCNIYKFNGKIDLAIKYGKECANAAPKNEWYQLLYIDCLNSKKQYNIAIEVYDRLIKNYPYRLDFHEGLAIEYMNAGYFEKSLKVYEDLEKRVGVQETLTINKIKLLLQLSKTNEIETEYQKLIQSNPTEIKYLIYLADYYQETNQRAKALEMYKKILAMDANNADVHLSLAKSYKAEGKKDSYYSELMLAIKNADLELETKLKTISEFFESCNDTILCKSQMKELCEVTLLQHPNSSDMHWIYADFLYQEKKVQEAYAEYDKAVKLDKTNFSLYLQLLKVEAELGDYKNLELNSFEAMELFPNQPIPYLLNGSANISLENYTKGITSLLEGLQFVNNNLLLIEFYSNLGEAYNSMKDYDKSNKAYDDALKVDPDNSIILNNYAYYLSLRKDKLEKASKYSKRSNEISPNNRSFMDTYGWILYQQGNYLEAEMWLSRAVKMGAKATILEHYGDVLYKLNKKEEALEYWKKAKKDDSNNELLEKKIIERKIND